MTKRKHKIRDFLCYLCQHPDQQGSPQACADRSGVRLHLQFLVSKDSQLSLKRHYLRILARYQLCRRDFGRLFWISTKDVSFFKPLRRRKDSGKRHNLPTSPLKTMKSKFINRRLTDCFWEILCRYLPCCVTPAYIMVCLLCSIAAGWCESRGDCV